MREAAKRRARITSPSLAIDQAPRVAYQIGIVGHIECGAGRLAEHAGPRYTFGTFRGDVCPAPWTLAPDPPPAGARSLTWSAGGWHAVFDRILETVDTATGRGEFAEAVRAERTMDGRTPTREHLRPRDPDVAAGPAAPHHAGGPGVGSHKPDADHMFADADRLELTPSLPHRYASYGETQLQTGPVRTKRALVAAA